MSVTCLVSKLDTSKYFNLEQDKNIFDISFTCPVLNLDKSKLVKAIQLLNI